MCNDFFTAFAVFGEHVSLTFHMHIPLFMVFRNFRLNYLRLYFRGGKIIYKTYDLYEKSCHTFSLVMHVRISAMDHLWYEIRWNTLKTDVYFISCLHLWVTEAAVTQDATKTSLAICRSKRNGCFFFLCRFRCIKGIHLCNNECFNRVVGFLIEVFGIDFKRCTKWQWKM